MIYIVNLKSYKGKCEIVSRPSILGNPFTNLDLKSTIAQYQIEGDCVLEYEKWIKNEILSGNQIIINEIKRLKKISLEGDLILACWCFPFRKCHAEIIKNLINL